MLYKSHQQHQQHPSSSEEGAGKRGLESARMTRSLVSGEVVVTVVLVAFWGSRGMLLYTDKCIPWIHRVRRLRV